MQKEIFLLSFPHKGLCRKSSSRPSPPTDASQDPGEIWLYWLFTGFRISPREAVLVRNDGFGELQHSLERGNPERVIPRKKE
jgi:hypothetical protein